MPVTPFHFGPGLLLKALAPRSFSFTAFAASQVVIDIESGYHLLRGEWPVHRMLHTLPVATLCGLATGAALWATARALRLPLRFGSNSTALSELRPLPSILGGTLGGLTHPILDGIMHDDLRPFWPWSPDNPLLGTIGLDTLHLACVSSGILGAILLWTKSWRVPT